MTTREKLLLATVVGVLAFWLNRAFLDWNELAEVLEMNDVRAILNGYEKVPNLFSDSGHWWRGTWIQEGIPAYRPLASYLYWIESWIGLRHGFVWVGWIGVLLLWANALLAGILAWRLTRSKVCVVLATLLGVSLRFYNWGNATPIYWLAWYPIHQELLLSAFLLGAIICFDLWQESAERKHLFGTWACFIFGALTKEHVYIFPAFAFTIAVLRSKNARVELNRSLLQCTLMLGGVLALWVYRAAIIINPRNPELRATQFLSKPFLYIFYPFYKHVLTNEFWFPGLAALLFGMGGALIRWQQSKHAAWLRKPFAPVAVIMACLGVIALYCALTNSATNAFWYLFDSIKGMMRLNQLGQMIATLYTVHLLWKYRKQEPTFTALAFLILSYVPVVSYLGWHYTVAAWFVRCAYWAVILKCAWLDLSPIILPRLPKFLFQLPLVAGWLLARLKSSPA